MGTIGVEDVAVVELKVKLVWDNSRLGAQRLLSHPVTSRGPMTKMMKLSDRRPDQDLSQSFCPQSMNQAPAAKVESCYQSSECRRENLKLNPYYSKAPFHAHTL